MRLLINLKSKLDTSDSISQKLTRIIPVITLLICVAFGSGLVIHTAHAISANESYFLQQQPEAFSAVDKYHLDWVMPQGPAPRLNALMRADVEIAAPKEVVWDIIRSPQLYAEISDNMIHANLIDPTGGMDKGKKIDFVIKLGGCLGDQKSLEEIGDFDTQLMAVSWFRVVDFGLKTWRWQFVVDEKGSSQASHYYTALEIPGLTGGAVEFLGIKNKIQKAFEVFAQGLKAKAELFYSEHKETERN